MSICKTFAISLKTLTKLKFDAKYKITIKKIKIYQAIVEYLIYLVFQTKFNIVFAIQKLTRFNLNSTKIVHKTTKKLFQYLQNIKNLNITYKQNEKLINYIDVDYVKNSIIKKINKNLHFLVARKYTQLIVKISKLHNVLVIRNRVYDANVNF